MEWVLLTYLGTGFKSQQKFLLTDKNFPNMVDGLEVLWECWTFWEKKIPKSTPQRKLDG